MSISSQVRKMPSRRSAFRATRLSSSTFLIKEFDDIYAEHPHIYAIIIPKFESTGVISSAPTGTILLIDTGCGGASNDPNIEITNLREFIETVEIPDNGGRPLNGGHGRMNYIVVTTHCHYDHILGVEHFSDSLIFASSHSPRFLEDIPEHSLCNFLHIRTPKYCPTLVHHGRNLGKTGVTFLHTFGHTPDSLSVYDPTSIPPMLYVGDLFYENEPIIFPNEGSIVGWFCSVEQLIGFVQMTQDALPEERSTQSDSEQRTILLNAGHITHSRPALLILRSVRSFMEDVIDGREPVRKTWIKRGERTLEYRQDAKTFSLICPERLILEARQSRRS